MPNAEKVNCDRCDGTGFLDYRGFSMDVCCWCAGTGTIEQSSKVAGTVKQSLTVPAGVKECLTTQTQDRLEELREWVDQQCPEGVSGMADNVRWLLGYAEDLAAADLHKRLSDAVTLLYTHGVITEKMRAHARRNL